MIKYFPTADEIAAYNTGDIRIYSRYTIYRTKTDKWDTETVLDESNPGDNAELLSFLKKYSFSADKELGINTCNLIFGNPEFVLSRDLFSAYNTIDGEFIPLLGEENKIKIEEGIADSTGTIRFIPKFTGIIKEIKEDEKTGSISVTAYGMLSLFKDPGHISYGCAPDEIPPTDWEQLIEKTTDSAGYTYPPRQVYQAANGNWVPYNLKIKTGVSLEAATDAFEYRITNYNKGEVIFDAPLDSGNYAWWYGYRYNMETNQAEQVIQEICDEVEVPKENIGDLLPSNFTIPRISYAEYDRKTYYDILEEVRRRVAPNYEIREDGDGKINSYFSIQNNNFTNLLANYNFENGRNGWAIQSDNVSIVSSVDKSGIVIDPIDENIPNFMIYFGVGTLSGNAAYSHKIFIKPGITIRFGGYTIVKGTGTSKIYLDEYESDGTYITSTILSSTAADWTLKAGSVVTNSSTNFIQLRLVISECSGTFCIGWDDLYIRCGVGSVTFSGSSGINLGANLVGNVKITTGSFTKAKYNEYGNVVSGDYYIDNLNGTIYKTEDTTLVDGIAYDVLFYFADNLCYMETGLESSINSQDVKTRVIAYGRLPENPNTEALRFGNLTRDSARCSYFGHHYYDELIPINPAWAVDGKTENPDLVSAVVGWRDEPVVPMPLMTIDLGNGVDFPQTEHFGYTQPYPTATPVAGGTLPNNTKFYYSVTARVNGREGVPVRIPVVDTGTNGTIRIKFYKLCYWNNYGLSPAMEGIESAQSYYIYRTEIPDIGEEPEPGTEKFLAEVVATNPGSGYYEYDDTGSVELTDLIVPQYSSYRIRKIGLCGGYGWGDRSFGDVVNYWQTTWKGEIRYSKDWLHPIWKSSFGSGLDLRGIIGFSDTEIYVCGPGGYVGYWNGTVLSQLSSPGTSYTLTGIKGSSGSNLYVCGYSQALDNTTIKIFKYNGSSWSTILTKSLSGLRTTNALWYYSDSCIMLAGSGFVYKYDGTTVTIFETEFPAVTPFSHTYNYLEFTGVSGNSDTNIYITAGPAGCYGGSSPFVSGGLGGNWWVNQPKLYRYNGSTTTEITARPANLNYPILSLFGSFTDSSGDVYIVGHRSQDLGFGWTMTVSNIYKYIQSSDTMVEIFGPERSTWRRGALLFNITGNTTNAIKIAVGNNSTSLLFYNGNWTSDFTSNMNLRDSWIDVTNNVVYSCGNNGVIARNLATGITYEQMPRIANRELDFSTANWTEFDESVLGPDIVARYIYLKGTQPAQMDIHQAYWVWEVTAYGEPYYDTLVEAVDPDIIEAEATTQNQELLDRYGIRTLALEVDPLLQSQEDVLKRAQDVLSEVERLKRSSSVRVLYNPFLAPLETILLRTQPYIEDENQGWETFFIENITVEKYPPSVSLEVVNYE